MNTYNVKATVITPVSIGNGHQLSSYKDYVIKNGFVHYIDTKKLGELLAKEDGLMDEYVEGVANMDGNRSRFDLQEFIANRLNFDISDITKEKLTFYGDAAAKLPLNTIIKTPNNEPYIPGSSLKGAIKTALVYTDLEKTDEGHSWQQRFLSQLSQIDFRNTREADKLNPLKSDLQQILLKNAEVVVDKITERMVVTDSHPLGKDVLEINDLRRTQIPVRQEVLPVKTAFEFSITFPDESWQTFGEKMNRFAFNNLSAAGKEEEVVFYQVEKAFDNSHEKIFLALGFGKGIYLNSILLSLKDYAYDNGKERLFENYLKHLSPKTKRLNIDSFPNTEFETWSKLPLGWIKLEKID